MCNFPCTSGYPHEGLPYAEGGRSFVERWYTPEGVRKLLDEFIPPEAYTMRVYGNRTAHMAYAERPKGLHHAGGGRAGL